MCSAESPQCYKHYNHGARCLQFRKPPHHRHTSIAKIRELLNRNRLESVAIEFARGDFTRGVSDLHQEELDHRAVQLPSMISQSLALENTNSSGTFGGFVELKMPGEARETELTPDLIEFIQRWRTSGIKPADHWRQKLRVRHPSSMAIKDKIQSLKAGIREIERDEDYIKFRELERKELQFTLGRGAKKAFDQMVETRNHMRGFLRDLHIFEARNRGAFGHVFAGSGLRATSTSPSSNLDWALIEVPPDRVSENITPDGHYLRDSPIPANLDGMPLFIHGQRSGYCKGKAHPLESAVLEGVVEDQVIKERLTYEHSILPIQGPRFSQAGDSGSLVFTDSYVVVGMLFADGNNHQISYFTHINHILDDIKHITNATDVRLKVHRPRTPA
ncbi:uncharacterized protein N7500_000084 [Penicillium coprophilum]|uniref:uncharacterized protein n=1 Tax=Penicillium coprophilum TaxID=36646 RepID=UPI00239F492E|nr:uncharacterized protein N7500_000084 [Penicillium coprophilum]KAJ5177385.1 hypothetical protein N7500_000084 [Penicillium coprophilum]